MLVRIAKRLLKYLIWQQVLKHYFNYHFLFPFCQTTLLYIFYLFKLNFTQILLIGNWLPLEDNRHLLNLHLNLWRPETRNLSSLKNLYCLYLIASLISNYYCFHNRHSFNCLIFTRNYLTFIFLILDFSSIKNIFLLI